VTEPAIRPAALPDGPGLAELDAVSWPVELQVVPPQPASEPFFTHGRRPQDLLVAEVDGALAGYIRLARHMSIADNDHVLHIDALVVHPAARSHGVGSLLLDAAIDEARHRGVRKLGLRALSTNDRALRLYRRHGFTEEGRLHAEFRRPGGNYADDVWLALWLTPRP
jgi:ribosomal protein S18 acetylase RimI-like enzyme